MSNFIAMADGSNLAHRHRVFTDVHVFNDYMGVNGEVAFLACNGYLVGALFNGVCPGGVARWRLTSGDVPLDQLMGNTTPGGNTGGGATGDTGNREMIAFYRIINIPQETLAYGDQGEFTLAEVYRAPNTPEIINATDWLLKVSGNDTPGELVMVEGTSFTPIYLTGEAGSGYSGMHSYGPYRGSTHYILDGSSEQYTFIPGSVVNGVPDTTIPRPDTEMVAGMGFAVYRVKTA